MRILLVMAFVAGCAHTSSSAVAPASPAAPVPHVTGGVHDFDDFAGAWSFVNKRLKVRNQHSTDFDTFPASSCTTTYLDGVANVDEVYFPTKGWAGLTVRTFDKAAQQWSIYWVNMKDGKVTPPVLGGFTGKEGNFYGPDTDDGKPILSRFHWIEHDKDHLTWEQYFSYDNGKTWEMNWTNDLTRVEWSTSCENGRPKR